MKLRIVIIDYGLGNIRSAQKSIELAMLESELNGEVIISSDSKSLKHASHIILPGQGSFEYCINGLTELTGMIEELTVQVIKKEIPLFGICVGMQLLANNSLENGNHKGLGWINAEITKLPTNNLVLPHMGWNEIVFKTDHSITNGIQNNNFYFVHSYYFKVENDNNIVATTNYGIEFPAIVAKNNIIGCQFHPEKSSADGIKILTNFLKQ